MKGLKAAFHRTRTPNCPGSLGDRDTLQIVRSEVLNIEQIAQQFAGAFSNNDRVRGSNALQACR